MNDHENSFPEPEDDLVLDELLAPLKRLQPPLETRINNRMAIAAELGSLNAVGRRRPLPWWRRSISIPAPMAATLVVLAPFMLLSSIRGWQDRAPVHIAAPVQPGERTDDRQIQNPAIAEGPEGTLAVMEYYETETYLCGIGRVQSESGYFIKDQVR